MKRLQQPPSRQGKWRRGIGLIEVMIAAAVVGIGLAAVLSSVVVYNSSMGTQDRIKAAIYSASVNARKYQMGDPTARNWRGPKPPSPDSNVAGIAGLRVRYVDYSVDTGLPGTDPYAYTYTFLAFFPPGEPTS